VIEALHTRDVARIAALATASARSWQAISPKADLDTVIALAGKLGALGVINTHSGTYLGLLFPDDPDVQLVADAMFDPFEYLVLRDKDGLLRKDFTRPLGNVSYHIPCHSRVQNVGQKTREALEWIPGTSVKTVERCAGHDGTWGVKEEYFAMSMKIGKPVFRQMTQDGPDYVSSDCPIAGRRIVQGAAAEGAARARKEHPLTLLRIAYGLD